MLTSFPFTWPSPRRGFCRSGRSGLHFVSIAFIVKTATTKPNTLLISGLQNQHLLADSRTHARLSLRGCDRGIVLLCFLTNLSEVRMLTTFYLAKTDRRWVTFISLKTIEGPPAHPKRSARHHIPKLLAAASFDVALARAPGAW